MTALVWVAALALLGVLPAAAIDREALLGYELQLPEESPNPSLVELGRLLFFDRRLSGDSTMSCATCHLPEEGFSDGREISAAYPTNAHFRNTPTVVNAALRPRLAWDGRAQSVEEQALMPVASPFEMNLNLDFLEERLRGIPEYRNLFRQALGADVTRGGVARALGALERTLIAAPSPFDRYVAGDDTALTPDALRGLELFFGRGGCTQCHDGPQFGAVRFGSLGLAPSSGRMVQPLQAATLRFFARTLGRSLPLGAEEDWGRGFVTGAPEDRSTFLAPTLRQLGHTAPYGHDGRFASLEEVVELLGRGGGTTRPRSAELRPLGLSSRERADLVAFLLSLTGPDPELRTPAIPP